MRNVFGHRMVLGLWLVLAMASGNPWDAAAQDCPSPVAQLVSVQGTVEARSGAEGPWRPVRLNDTLCRGTVIRVLGNSRADLTLMDRSYLRVNENTTIVLEGVLEERTSLIDLLKGAAHFLSREPRSVRVKTQYAIFGVRGTEFYVRSGPEEAFISVFAGAVLAENAAGDMTLTDGESAVVRPGTAPVATVVARPRDAVRWALYYPPVLHDLPPGLLEADPAALADPRELVQRAALLLEVGRVDEASADLDRALALSPGFAEALALQAVIAIVGNDKDQALVLAQQAVDADPGSAAAWIALSYARQARFDLEGARDALEKAAAATPENPLVWARLAEVQAAFGHLDKALAAARKAEALAPDLSLTQTVLGFAYLTQVRIDPAMAAFEKAIVLDQAAPLPRLGLGLAKIRRGHLEAGRRELEIAASLDPNNSLVRSYLGKAYYEERRMPLDQREFRIAKELDPNDPTPWFYDAIALQTTNRPVEALENLQKAIDLNDNRFVYRSKLLLDSDLAARGAGLGRVYDNLGFQQLGLVEGWKSVNTDAGSFSAHRLLADLYASQPRHEIARVSELFQSQLLQPLNIAPVQPQLAESSLFIYDGAGPSDLSFNEFNPLFLRNRLAVQGNGVIGSNDTLGNDLAQSGVWNRLSYSVGQFHYETDGFRENNDLEIDIFNVFTQASLSPKTSVLGEIRYSETEKGDLEITFPNTFNPFLRQKEIVRSTRLGLHHQPTPAADLVAAFIYQNADLDSDVIPGFFELKSDIENYLGEMQYLQQMGKVSLTGGFGYSHRNETLNDTGFETDADRDFANVYVYTHFQILDRLTLTLGAGGNALEGDQKNEDRNQFNPKFGLIWNPLPDTTLRAAAFRTLQRPYISQQNPTPTIEPTQVAGFNQFYADTSGTDAWRYGIGVDQKLPLNIFAGSEFSYRDVESTFTDLSGFEPEVNRRDWDERQFSAYLYWPPLSWLALRTEYSYDRFSRDISGGFSAVEDFEELETHQVTFGAAVFLPCGFTSELEATYVDQNGDFVVFSETGDLLVEPGDDQFWVVDASIGYRLPKRYGMLSLEAKNLFDSSFQFQDIDPASPRIFPERQFLFKVSLAF